MKKKTEDCSHRTQSNPIQSMDGSNPRPTLPEIGNVACIVNVYLSACNLAD